MRLAGKTSPHSLKSRLLVHGRRLLVTLGDEVMEVLVVGRAQRLEAEGAIVMYERPRLCKMP